MKTLVDSGALTMALNVLRRAGKGEVADALAQTAERGPNIEVTLSGADIVHLAEFAGFQVTGPEVDSDEYLEEEYRIAPCPEAGVRSDDNEVVHSDFVAVCVECPEEGCIILGKQRTGGVGAIPLKPPLENRLVKLEDLVHKHGICTECGELYEHSYDSPFASCGCNQAEWYELTPHMKAMRPASQ